MSHLALLISAPVGGSDFGQNFEIYSDSEEKALCGFGSADRKPEYVIVCSTGPVHGRIVRIKNIYSGGLKLCDVQVFGNSYAS